MKRRLTLPLLLGLLLVVNGKLLPAQVAKKKADPFTGTWRLDPSKTEDSNPNQVTIESISKGISIRANDSKPILAEYGKDSPAPNGDQLHQNQCSYARGDQEKERESDLQTDHDRDAGWKATH